MVCFAHIDKSVESRSLEDDPLKVEGIVGYSRRNFMVPIPRASSWEELNAQLAERCRRRRERRLRGHKETIGERFERDRATMLPLPAAPYEACEKVSARVSSLSLVRYRSNDYSVPTQYGYRQVWVKGYVREVVIACLSEVIARHQRSYEREAVIFDPLHYLALLDRLTHHVHILEMNGDSYRRKQSRRKRGAQTGA
jgi:hypothetical protein